MVRCYERDATPPRRAGASPVKDRATRCRPEARRPSLGAEPSSSPATSRPWSLPPSAAFQVGRGLRSWRVRILFLAWADLTYRGGVGIRNRMVLNALRRAGDVD